MTESDIIRELARYSRDRKQKFFTHVKDGSCYSRQQRILDGFAINDRQFKNVVTVGYEIKVSRSDFLRDDKWQEYLPVCTSFYFVSPPGIIEKSDLPDGIGLLHCDERGALTRIKSAKRRELDHEKLFEVFKYLVFNRTLSENEHVKAATRRVRRLERELVQAQKESKSLQKGYNDIYLELRALKRGRVI